ncbi:hypothetical protein BB559_003017 [Furculomyces boomerangus]|uniref:RRM domain-containing protein n=1 Tax=Furculomyces boomerangus TaxID=61424 RepID=A0A2T9YQ67_9FUNG|nr:hypothetical protein BB559_003017 [Furculomyces boomerangus]
MKVFPKPEEFKNNKDVKYETETEKYVYYDQDDKIEYEYDEKTNAWFPRWNESLVEEQQSVYSKNDIEQKRKSPDEIEKVHKQENNKEKKKINYSVYVTGLPLDVTEDEVEEVFKKCGTIMPDIITGKPRIKVYRDEKGIPKGDALITYFKEPSVSLAIDILDDSLFRYDEPRRIKVQVAKFTEKKQVDGPQQKKTKIDPNLIKKRIQQLEKKLEWDEEGAPISEKYNKMVVLVGMFTQDEIKNDVTLLIDLKEDIREECEKVGQVTNIKIYEDSNDGLVVVKFTDKLGAQAAVKLLNGRFFAGRQIEAFISTGKVKLDDKKNIDLQDMNTNNEERGTSSSAKLDISEQERLESYAQWLEKEDA